jgi:hypothetical protein
MAYIPASSSHGAIGTQNGLASVHRDANTASVQGIFRHHDGTGVVAFGAYRVPLTFGANLLPKEPAAPPMADGAPVIVHVDMTTGEAAIDGNDDLRLDRHTFMRTPAVEQLVGKNAGFQDFIRTYTSVPAQTDSGTARRSEPAEQRLITEFPHVPPRVVCRGHDGREHTLVLPRTMRRAKEKGSAELDAGDRSRAIRVLSNRNGSLDQVPERSGRAKGIVEFRYRIPHWAAQDAGTAVSLFAATKADGSLVVTEAILQEPNAEPLHLQFSDVTKWARTAIAGFFGRKSIALELFQNQRLRIVRDLLLKDRVRDEAELQETIDEIMDEPPDVEEIAAHLHAYEDRSGQQVSCELRTLEARKNLLTPEQTDRLRDDFRPVPGRKIIFEDNRGLCYVRTTDNGDGLEYLAEKGQWKTFDIDTVVNSGLADATRQGQRYRAEYILNKPGAVNAPTQSVPGSSSAPGGDMQHKTTRMRLIRSYGDFTVEGWPAGRYFVTNNVGTSFGSMSGSAPRHLDDAVDFVKMLTAAGEAKHHALQDLMMKLGQPSNTVSCMNRFGTYFHIDEYPVTLTVDGEPPEHFCLYVNRRDDFVLSMRALYAEYADVQVFMEKLLANLNNRTGYLERIARAGGVPPIDRPKPTEFIDGEEMNVVTYHTGTPYEHRYLTTRIGGLEFSLDAYKQKQLTDFAKTMSTVDKKWTSKQLLHHILTTHSNMTVAARTVDFDLRKYEFDLASFEDYPHIVVGCVMYLMTFAHSEPGRPPLAGFVFPYPEEEAPPVGQILAWIDNTLDRKNITQAMAISQKASHFFSPIPVVTEDVEMVTVGGYWMKQGAYAAAKEQHDLPQLMDSAGLDPRCPGSFFRKALSLCRTPEKVHKLKDSNAVLERHRVTIHGRHFYVYVGRHAELATNLALHVEITAGDAPADDTARILMYAKVRATREFQKLAMCTANDGIPARLDLVERDGACLFNVNLNGKDHVFEPVKDFLLPYPTPQISGYRVARRVKLTEDRIVVGEAIRSAAAKLRAMNGGGMRASERDFYRAALSNAIRCTDEISMSAEFKTDDFIVRFYDTEVAGEHFKMAVISPFPKCGNLVVSVEFQSRDGARPKQMASSTRQRIPEGRTEVLRNISAMIERGETLPDLIEVPDDVRQKMSRIAASRANVAPGAGQAQEAADDVEVDVSEDSEPAEGMPSLRRFNARQVSVKTYATVDEFLDALLGGEDVAEIADACRKAVRFELDGIRDAVLVRGREHEQLQTFGRLWHKHVRFVSPQESGSAPRAEIRSRQSLRPNDPRNRLRKSKPENPLTSKQQGWIARVVGREIARDINMLLRPLNISAVSGWNPIEPMVREGTRWTPYESIIRWAASREDGGRAAAAAIVRWMKGRTTLENLPPMLRMLAVITHYSEVGRGYSSALAGLKLHMAKIGSCGNTADAAVLWKNLADEYPPMIDWKTDLNAHYDVSGWNMSGSEAVSESESEPEDIVMTLENEAAKDLKELVPVQELIDEMEID